jgi:hypothetical protein
MANSSVTGLGLDEHTSRVSGRWDSRLLSQCLGVIADDFRPARTRKVRELQLSRLVYVMRRWRGAIVFDRRFRELETDGRPKLSEMRSASGVPGEH